MFNIILFLYLVVLLLAAYVMFLADPDAPGLHGKASVWLLVTVPEKLSQLATRVFGEKMSKQLWNVYDYCVNQRNPILIITYEAILNSAFLAWLIYGYPMVTVHYYVYLLLFLDPILLYLHESICFIFSNHCFLLASNKVR